MASSHFFVAIVLLFLAAISSLSSAKEVVTRLKLDSHILQDSIIKEVNENRKAGWEAARNPQFSNYTVAQFKHLLGVKPTPKRLLLGVPFKTHEKSDKNSPNTRSNRNIKMRIAECEEDPNQSRMVRMIGGLSKSLKLPKSFDARTAWPQCSTISQILDQGHCGSCWAFGAVESISDRFCIHYGMNMSLSVNDLLACCGFLCGDGCDGGYPISAWQYFVHHGVVTEECDPYFDTTGCSHPGCEPAYPTPKCVRKCVDKNQLWRNSKHYGVSAYRIDSNPQNIMAEIYKNGPVEVSFTVYEDFAHYKSGIYKYTTGDVMGGHAVKLIGWGTSEDGEDYWILANQWNRGWGEKGYFKIKRGTNECGIEDDVVAGLPSTRNLVKEVTSGDEYLDASA